MDKSNKIISRHPGDIIVQLGNKLYEAEVGTVLNPSTIDTAKTAWAVCPVPVPDAAPSTMLFLTPAVDISGFTEDDVLKALDEAYGPKPGRDVHIYGAVPAELSDPDLHPIFTVAAAD